MSEETKIRRVRLSELSQHERNANTGTLRGRAALEDAIRQHGAADAGTLDRNGVILSGNKRAEVYSEAGMDEVLVVETDGHTPVFVQRTDVEADMPEGRALALALNRVAELDLAWDPEELQALAEEGMDLGQLWTDEEFAALVAGEPEAPEGGLKPDADPDEVPENVETRCKPGDLWRLGSAERGHRLLCGDSTKPEDVARLMAGEKAGLMNTDPPYGCNAGNIGFTAQRDDIEAIRKDDLEGVEMQAFLERAFAAAIPHLTKNAAWYLWHPMLTQGYFAAAAAAAADLIIHRQIIWRKEQFIFGRGDYHWRHELCFYGWRQGNRPPFYGPRNQDTIWEIAWGEKRGEIGHPTAKPVGLFAIPIRNHLKRGEVCFEPFCGSGSQVVAAERERVRCYALEQEPKYCDIILARWEHCTGRQAARLE